MATCSLVQGVRVNTKAVYVPQRSRNASLSKQMHQSMNALWVINMKVPKHGIIRNIRLRMTLVAPVHGRKLDGVPDEKHGQVVKDKVLDALFGVKLGCPASDIADCVTGSFFTADGGESGENLCLFADAG
jgi:hypothetical protein